MFFEYEIEQGGQTIDSFLRKKGYSRRLIIALKNTDNGILVDGEKRFTNYSLSPGEKLVVTLPPEEDTEHMEAVELPFDVIYEDDHIIAVNKPADMPIHPSINNYGNTLANAAAWYFKEKGIPFTFRCVNRLDRDTTGLVLLAKHALSGCILSEMVKKRTLKREYLCICEGIIEKAGTVNLPIGRLPGSAVMRCIDQEQGDKAITHYTPVAWERDRTLLRIQLETGRTHQIRVHMGALGHPLPGDYLYNPDYTYIDRQPLHSESLTFPHPVTGEMLHLMAPVPEDMRRLFPEYFSGGCIKNENAMKR